MDRVCFLCTGGTFRPPLTESVFGARAAGPDLTGPVAWTALAQARPPYAKL